MTMGMYRHPETEEDFAYVKNFRNMIQGELSEFLDCELHVHRSGAFLILGEDCRMGRCFRGKNPGRKNSPGSWKPWKKEKKNWKKNGLVSQRSRI